MITHRRDKERGAVGQSEKEWDRGRERERQGVNELQWGWSQDSISVGRKNKNTLDLCNAAALTHYR